MKKTRFALFAAAALALVACVQEVQEEKTTVTPEIGENTLAFTIQSGIATRSAEENAVIEGETLSLGEPVLGQNVSLEETITSLDGIYPEINVSDAPETRGTPVYSQNFKEAVGSFRGQAFPYQAFSYRVDRPTEGTLPSITEGNFDPLYGQWVRKFDSDPWGEAEDLYFFARVVKDDPSIPIGQQTGVLTNSYQFSYDAEQGQQMTFSYRSALTAVDQQDILFAARAINKADANKGIDILFYHALTGVKFATAHANDGETKTFIDKVEFTGIYGYGKCFITSVTEDDDYKDDPEFYSSMRAIRWEPTFTTSGNYARSKETVYSQEFSETAVDYAEGGSFGNKGKYANSFAAGGNTNNLNATDGSMTFWMVPQEMTDDVKLKVTFRIQSGNRVSEPITREIDFGKELNAKNGKTIIWKAGELRTYTLKANEVDVIIEDDIDGDIKKDVVITNTGNVSEYVRAQIVGNWFGKGLGGVEGIAMGFISDDETNHTYVTPWELGPVVNGKILNDNNGGVFDGLPGDKWVIGNDGFFYFTEVVDVTKNTSTPLFKTFTYASDQIPTVYYIDNKGNRQPFTEVHLKMNIAVQAVEAPLKEGSTTEYEDYVTAWAAAKVTAPAAPVSPSEP